MLLSIPVLVSASVADDNAAGNRPADDPVGLYRATRTTVRSLSAKRPKHRVLRFRRPSAPKGSG